MFHDLRRVQQKLGELQRCFPASAVHAVAIKANPLVEVLRAALETGAGLEAASLEEAYIAQAAGCPTHKIVFDSPAKTRDELAEALRLGMLINVDNWSELQRIDELLGDTVSRSPIGLRINPMVGAGTIGITSVAHGDSKFGIDLDLQHKEILEAYRRHPWLTGIHIHVGSQGCDVPLLVAAAVRVQTLVGQIHHFLGYEQIQFVDIGGGLAAKYLDQDQPPEIAAYAEDLRHAAPTLFNGKLRLITEFGRAIQAGCGFTVSRVEYTKQISEQRLAVLHVGADLALRLVYLPQQWPHRYLLLDSEGRIKSGDTQGWALAGPLCFAGDIVAQNVPLPEIEPEDLLVIRDTGAYTLSMWSRHCNRAIPKVLGVDSNNSIRLLRERESLDAVARFWGASSHN